MTSARRVAAVGRSLGAQEMVLQILAEARQFAGLEQYARSIIDQPEEAAPLNRIAAAAAASVRAAMKGESRDAVDGATRRATANGIFTFLLALGINGAALEIARVEGIRAAATFFWMGCLLGGPREQDLEPAEWAEHQKDHAEAWRSWRAVVAGLLATVVVEEDARAELEKRYLAGQSSLLADAEDAWERFAELVDRLWSMAEDVVPLSAAEKRRVAKNGHGRYDERVAERVQTLADNARIVTFDRLGENRRALRILEGRLASR